MSKLRILDQKEDEKEPWYKDGLHFKCTGCGKCCSGSPGYVYLSEEDIERLCKHLKVTREEFITKYTKTVNRQLSLRDDTKNWGCIFLKDERSCSVYEARPTQCRTYPFWIYNIGSQKQWDRESKHCEGINHPDSVKVSKETIERIAAVHAGLLPESELPS